MATFGERVKELRKQRGLTQRQMTTIFEVTERGSVKNRYQYFRVWLGC